MPSVVIIHQHFLTPNQGGTLRLWFLSQFLAQKGLEVKVISGNSFSSSIEAETLANGVRLIRLPIQYHAKMAEGQRVISFLKFAVRAYLHLLSTPKPNLIYATSTPLTVVIPALLYRWFNKVPYFLELRDLWPTIPIEMGFLKAKWKQRLAFLLEQFGYKNAKGIICLSPESEKRVKKIAPSSKVLVAPNFSDITFFTPSKKDIQSKCIVVYVGSLGLANGLERLVQFSSNWESVLPNTHELWIYGSGPKKEALQCSIKDKTHILLKGSADRETIKKAYELANFAFVCFANYPSLSSCSPNKFFEALAAGVPVITNMTGWIKNLVETSNIGLTVNDDFYDFNSLLSADNQVVWARNARQLAESEFDVQSTCEKIYSFISDKT